MGLTLRKALKTHFKKSTKETLYSCATVCANEEDYCSASFKTESRKCNLFSSCGTTEDQLFEIAGVHTLKKTPISGMYFFVKNAKEK